MVLVAIAAGASAQDLEPRASVNTPVGLNFLVAGYVYSQGGLSTDPSLPIQNAQLEIHGAVLAYARSLDVWGRSGKFDVIVPYAQLSGTADVAGQPRDRDVSGFGDPRFRFSVLLYGAPALSLKEFASYRQDVIVGASVQVSAPGGQYDPTRAVNIATNRWSAKPEIGISKALGDLTLELSTGVTFYSRNDDYFGGRTLEQDHLLGAGARHLTLRRRCVGRIERHLLSGWAHDGRRRERQRRAGEFACGRYGRAACGPAKLGQIARQHRRIDPHRDQLQDRRDRVAAPLGRGALMRGLVP